jgi:hypothetical protein
MTGNAADYAAAPRTVTVTISAEAAAIERGLRAAGRPDQAAREKAYLKSDLEFGGTPAADIRSVAKAWSRARLALLMVPRPAGTPAGRRRRPDRGHVAHLPYLGAGRRPGLTEAFPQLTGTLDRWARDGDFWVRRSALLALLGPLRRGGGDFERSAASTR